MKSAEPVICIACVQDIGPAELLACYGGVLRRGFRPQADGCGAITLSILDASGAGKTRQQHACCRHPLVKQLGLKL